MEIKREQAIAAYEVADENGKKMLEALFGADTFTKQDNRPVEERIKTFDDAVNALGYEHPLVRNYLSVVNDCEAVDNNLEAYLRLRIVCAALNEGWEPKFTKNEWRYYPWFFLFTDKEIADMDDAETKARHLMCVADVYETEYAGFGFAYSSGAPSDADAPIGSRLCLKSDALAAYCGKQFIDLWADYLLIRK